MNGHRIAVRAGTSGGFAGCVQAGDILRAGRTVIYDIVGPEGSEAYGNIGAWRERTRPIMKGPLDALPAWLGAAAALLSE